MGNRERWLALGAGIAGSADVILIPEIPHDVEKVAAAIQWRQDHGTNFSILAVAEGALSRADAAEYAAAKSQKKSGIGTSEYAQAIAELAALKANHDGNTWRLSKQLEKITKLESRITILGYQQRGGTPSVADRMLATRLGT